MNTQETKNCPFCGKEIFAVAKKCKYCGEWLDNEAKDIQKRMIKCPFCAEEIEEGLEICPLCKESLVKTQEKEVKRLEPDAGKQLTKKKSKMSTTLKVILFIIGWIVLMLIVKVFKNVM